MDHSDHATVIAAATMAESMYLGDSEKRQALQKAMEGSISAPSVVRSAEVRPEHIVIPLSPAGQETFAQRMEEETEKAIEALRLLAEADRNGPSSPEEAENMIATATRTLLLTASDHLAPLVLLTPRTNDPASEAAARRGVDYLLRHVHYTLKKAKALLRAAETNRDSQRRDTLRKAAKKSLVESDLQRMTRTANLVLAAMHAGKKSEIRGGEALEVSKAEREGAAAMATARDGLAKAQTELLAAQEGEADASAVAVLEAAVGVRQVAVEGAEAAATARTGSAEAQTELVAARAAGAEASELEGLEAVAKAKEVTGHGAKAVATEREGFAADCAAQDCHSEPEPAEDSQPPALLLWGGKTVTDTWGGQPYEIFGTWPEPTLPSLRTWGQEGLDQDLTTIAKLRHAYRRHAQRTMAKQRSGRIDALSEALSKGISKGATPKLCAAGTHKKGGARYGADAHVVSSASITFPDQDRTIEGVVLRDKQEMVEYYALWYSNFFRSTTEFHDNTFADPVEILLPFGEKTR